MSTKEQEKDSQTSSKSKSKSKAKRTTSLNNETDEYKNQANNLNTSFNDGISLMNCLIHYRVSQLLIILKIA